MTKDVVQHTKRLRRRKEDPVQGIIAASALGREAILLREGLGRTAADVLGPGVLGSEDADNAFGALISTLEDMNVSSQQRAAAAWTLGQIGGPEPTRELLKRLGNLFVEHEAMVLGSADRGEQQEEEKDVCAALIQALSRALDEPTIHTLNQYDLQRLRQVCNALLDRTLKESDPDLSSALAMSLAKIALRIQTDLLSDILQDLLQAPEPIATLATIGALTEKILATREVKILDSLYDSRPNPALDNAFRELETERGRPYSPQERHHLLRLTAQLRHTEQVTQVASDHMWREIVQNML
jgi:hypothetical protein